MNSKIKTVTITTLVLTKLLTSCGFSTNDNSKNQSPAIDTLVITEKQAMKNVAPKKTKIFNEVSQVRSKLSEIGIGNLGQWENDSYSWMSSSSYYLFGSASTENGMQNNLAYYLESQSENFIETIELVLNVNNSDEKSQALSLMDKTSLKTFTSLSLKMPDGLSNSIKSGKNFNSENSDFKVSLLLVKSRIETWRLTIEPK